MPSVRHACTSLRGPRNPRSAAVLPDHQCDGLRGVECAAAAERDDAVVPPAAIHRDAAADVGFDRVALHVGVDLAAEAGAPARFHRGGDHRQRGEARIGHEQRTLHAEVRQASGSSAMRPAPNRIVVG